MARATSRLRFGLTVLLMAQTAMAHAAGALSTDVCGQAGREAELQYGLPIGMLVAIGLVESSRRDPVSGVVRSWPWSINVEGRDRFAATAAEAAGDVRSLQETGRASIDVGCFQINLLHHAGAFANLDEAFDPTRNAAYAAQFLLTLYARTGSWEGAIAHYHSANDEKGLPYRDRVLRHWLAAGGTVPAAIAATGRPASSPAIVQTVSHGVTVWTPGVRAAQPVGAGTPNIQIPLVKVKYW